MMNKDHIYDEIMATIDPNNNGLRSFFQMQQEVQETYVLNAILAAFRAEGLSSIATASSGIAATLLKGDRTANSQFGIPIPILPTSICPVKRNSKLDELINSVSDEALIFPSNNVLAVDRMIMDFTKNDKFFGNKILILCGDPRQTLPVIPEGS